LAHNSQGEANAAKLSKRGVAQRKSRINLEGFSKNSLKVYQKRSIKEAQFESSQVPRLYGYSKKR
jgi:hypothetical protein